VLIYRCRRCGAVLFIKFAVHETKNVSKGRRRVDRDEVKIGGITWTGQSFRYFGPPTPSELSAIFGNHCPACGAPLSLVPKRVRICIDTENGEPQCVEHTIE